MNRFRFPFAEGQLPVLLINPYAWGLLSVYACVLLLPWPAFLEGIQPFSVQYPLFWVLALGLFTAIAAVSFLHGKRSNPVSLTDHPPLAVLIPVLNEERFIQTCVQSVLDSGYPLESLDVVVINDGSTDATSARVGELMDAGLPVRLIQHGENRGKREALITGINATQAEFILFLDSDTTVEHGTLDSLIKPLIDGASAICGDVSVQSASPGPTAFLQVFDYFISFRFFKAFEGRYGAVTCAPGCFSAYRREALLLVLPEWTDQEVLGVACSYGEDRYLTSLLLQRGRVGYQPGARAHTLVPGTLSSLLVQRLRWSRSWFINTLLVARFMWTKPFPAAAVFYVISASTLLVPAWLIRALMMGGDTWLPVLLFTVTLLGIQVLLAVLQQEWRAVASAPLFLVAWLLILIWLVPLAVLTITDNAWGSRR